MKYLTLVIFALLITACKKSERLPNNTLEGTWVLKKLYSDPGDGSGTYVDVSEPVSTLTFNTNGSVSSTISFFGLNTMKSYSALENGKIEFAFKEVSSLSTTTFNYQFKQDTLVLNPPCIEGCGLKFVRQ